MNRIINLLLITIISVSMTACAGLTRESICGGIESSPLGIANPFMLGCLVSDVVIFGSKVASDLSSKSSSQAIIDLSEGNATF